MILRCLGTLGGGAALALALGAQISSAREPDLATAWVKDHASSVRLIAGGASASTEPGRLYAGIDIRLNDGWKTYWRNPGSSGVPPRIDFAGSDNLGSADLLFPAPERFPEKDGDTIGYKTAVVLPIAVKPVDAAKPVTLKLALEYGVCKDICIPVLAELSLTLPPDAARRPGGAALEEAIKRVPRPLQSRRPTDPLVKSITTELAGPKPKITIEAEFPGGATGADVFLEAPDNLWIPLARPAEEAPQSDVVRRFEVDLTDGADLKDLKGRTIRLTLVSAAGQSETSFKLE